MGKEVGSAAGGIRGRVDVEGKQGHLLDGSPLALRALGEEQHREEHGKGQAHEDGDGENFHVPPTKPLPLTSAIQPLL